MGESTPAAPARRLLNPWTAAAGLGGGAAAVELLAHYGVHEVLGLLWRAGPGLAAVICLHLLQLWLTAIAWRALIPRCSPVPSRLMLLVLRLIREGINTLLPLSQIAGIAAAVRVLCLRGLRPAVAIAATVGDMTVELVTQVVFTLTGFGILVVLLGRFPLAVPLLIGLAVFVAMVVALIAAQRLGLSRVAAKAAARFGWSGRIEELRPTIEGVYRRRGSLVFSATCHLLAWAFGAVEVCVALHFLGRDTGLGRGFVIESLGQTIKAASFAVPGALGVQEGGFVVVCALFGIGADVALALSLLKRLRDVVLGAPGLVLWLGMERSGRRLRHTGLNRISSL